MARNPKSNSELLFPVAGIDRRLSFRGQPPFTTYDAQNVRPIDPIEQRARGGSRPGLSKAMDTQLGTTGGSPVNMLGQVSYVVSSTSLFWSDSFWGTALSSVWSVPAWLTAGAPTVSDDGYGTATGAGGAVRDALGTPTKIQLHTSGDVSPIEYKVYFRMNNTTPVPTTDGCVLTVNMVYTTAWAVTGTLKVYVGGVETSYTLTGCAPTVSTGEIKVTISSNTITVAFEEDWGATHALLTQTIAAQSGTRYGFELSANGIADVINVWYTTTGSDANRTQLVAAAFGTVYYESADRTMTAIAGSSVNASNQLQCAEWNQKLYIADHTGGGGTTKIKIYNPATNALADMTASAGTAPVDCPLICRFRDRIVVGGPDHQWYMSKMGDPTNWNYSADVGDVGRAIAGQSSSAGTIGEPLRAMITHSDDYLLFGCMSSLWLLMGDPACGGAIHCLSRNIGIIDKGAWCYGPSGEVYFVSLDGLYTLLPGAGQIPQSMSRDKMPKELCNIDPTAYRVLLQYDVQRRGIHIFVTPINIASTAHWWFDMTTRSFWKDSYQSTHEPMSIAGRTAKLGDENMVVLGCRDGYLRRHTESSATDDGTSFTSYVWYGPVRLGDATHDGLLTELTAVLGEGSEDITYGVYTADTMEQVFTSTVRQTGTWVAGLNYTDRSRTRGGAMGLKLSSTLPWAIENIVIGRLLGGMQRKP